MNVAVKGAIMNFWWPLKIIRLMGCAVSMGFQSMWGFLKGFLILARISVPTVTFFAGKGALLESEVGQQVYQLARLLVKNNISVLTGGGPGLMEAANCGAASVQSKKNKTMTLGIGVSNVDSKFVNKCAYVIKVPYFFIRQWLLVRYSQAFIVFPGGIGTADELFETLNLMKLDKIPRVPMILIGTRYWQPLVDWYKQAHAQKFIPEHAKDLFVVVDDINQAFEIVKKSVR